MKIPIHMMKCGTCKEKFYESEICTNEVTKISECVGCYQRWRDRVIQASGNCKCGATKVKLFRVLGFDEYGCWKKDFICEYCFDYLIWRIVNRLDRGLESNGRIF